MSRLICIEIYINNLFSEPKVAGRRLDMVGQQTNPPLHKKNPFIYLYIGSIESFATIEDPGEMPQNAAFHLGLHCYIAITKSIFRERKCPLTAN